MGVPEQIVTELAKLNNSTIFVETGTYHGGTTRWASKHFETVHTIERAESLFNAHSRELVKLPGVTPHQGDSREVLPRILEDIGDRSAVFWLDGHWSGGETAGADDECPILGELAILSGRTEDIILIDDARLFLCAPPLPHKASQWPTIPDIVEAAARPNGQPLMQIVDDVLFMVPITEALRDHLISYSQRRANQFWREFAEIQRNNCTHSQRSQLPQIISKLSSKIHRKTRAG